MNKNEIEKLAFELYVNSGCKEGRDLDNWIEAEKILTAAENVELKQDVDFEFKELVQDQKEIEPQEVSVVL